MKKKDVNEKEITAAASFLFVAKLFLKKRPSKVIIECILSAMNQILVVVNSVWLLECLTNMVFVRRPFSDSLTVLVVVVGINILASVVFWQFFCFRIFGFVCGGNEYDFQNQKAIQVL